VVRDTTGKPARDQLAAALAAKGWTLDRLIEEAGVRMSRGSLHRKLYGYRVTGRRRRVFQPISLEQYRKLGVALGILDDDALSRLDQLAADVGALGTRGVSIAGSARG
jgi:hypothetical protein